MTKSISTLTNFGVFIDIKHIWIILVLFFYFRLSLIENFEFLALRFENVIFVPDKLSLLLLKNIENPSQSTFIHNQIKQKY